jgi:type IV pilus assembly protein PilM
MRYGFTMRDMLSTYPIGIDIDDRSLSVAQFRKTSRGIRLRRLFCRPLAAEETADDAALTAAFREIISSKLFKGRRVTFNIPFRDLSVVPVRFPDGEIDDPEEAILREATKFLPYPLEEAVIDYPSLVHRSGNCEAIVIAVRRRVMDRWLAIMRGAGMTAEAMEFSISSLLRLHRTIVPSDGRVDLLCHIGRTSSLLAVVDGESILSFSEIAWGVGPLWEKIGMNLNLPDGGNDSLNLLKVYGLAYMDREAVPMTTDGGTGHGDRNMYRVIYQVVAPAVDELVYECHKTISYLRSLQGHAAFGTVYLYGLANQICYLDRYLEGHVGIPTQGVDALTRLGYAGPDPCLGVTDAISPVPALGLAMRQVPWL